MAQNNLSIAIIGGGIGGLAAAFSLLQAGFDVHVYEQVRARRVKSAPAKCSRRTQRACSIGLAFRASWRL
jgi:2-polyprenyl-6-methoxyphenol hydroxylase-like FAD-dependent oxidoreductase